MNESNSNFISVSVPNATSKHHDGEIKYKGDDTFERTKSREREVDTMMTAPCELPDLEDDEKI